MNRRRSRKQNIDHSSRPFQSAEGYGIPSVSNLDDLYTAVTSEIGKFAMAPPTDGPVLAEGIKSLLQSRHINGPLRDSLFSRGKRPLSTYASVSTRDSMVSQDVSILDGTTILFNSFTTYVLPRTPPHRASSPESPLSKHCGILGLWSYTIA